MLCRIFFTLTSLVLYAQVYSALTGCNLNCPNGLVLDASGCETCRCKQVVCGPDRCTGINCPYGREKDQNGCTTCRCHEPCPTNLCPSGQACQVVKDNRAGTYTGQCIKTVTEPSCEAVGCKNKCQYGFKADHRGCHTCLCLDPCENRRCGMNQRCVIGPCGEGDGCRDYTANCVDYGSQMPSYDLGRENPQPMKVDDRLKPAMRDCCANASLSGMCLTICQNNQILADFSKCLNYQKMFTYLRCISVFRTKETAPQFRLGLPNPEAEMSNRRIIDLLPRAGLVQGVTSRPVVTMPTEDPLQTAMRQCCVSAGLSGTCLAACSSDSTRVLSDFSTCFKHPVIWQYIRCISVFRAKETMLRAANQVGFESRFGLVDVGENAVVMQPNQFSGNGGGSMPPNYQFNGNGGGPMPPNYQFYGNGGRPMPPNYQFYGNGVGSMPPNYQFNGNGGGPMPPNYQFNGNRGGHMPPYSVDQFNGYDKNNAVQQPKYKKNTMLQPKSKKNTMLQPKSKKNTMLQPKSKKNTMLQPKSKKNTMLQPKSKKNTMLQPKSKKNTMLQPKSKKNTMLQPKSKQNTMP